VLVKTDASVLIGVAAKALVPNPLGPRAAAAAAAIILYCHHPKAGHRFLP
jgi:hypothetical protein